jgi:hypothetical protein
VYAQECRSSVFAFSFGALGEAVARASDQARERRLVSLTFASWNLIGDFLRRLDALKQAG